MEIKRITPQFEQKRQQQLRHFDKDTTSNSGYSANANSPAFTGFLSAAMVVPNVFLRFLDTNQAWGANLVDVGSMVVPRTYYDTRHRGIATGLETGRRESTGTFNHAMVGVYGTAAGAALAMGLNRAYKFKAHKIFANNDTLNILGDHWFNALKSGSSDPLSSYLDNVLSNIKFYNPSRPDAFDGMVSLSDETKALVKAKYEDLIKNGKKDIIGSKDVNYIRTLMAADTGAERSVVLNGFFKGQPLQADNTLSTLIENIHNVTKAFRKPEAVKSFKQAASAEAVDLLKSLKKLNVSRSVAGLGFAALFGMSVQPINMYLTRKKTGCDGFPGVPGRKRDKSKKFLAMKAAMSAIFGAGALSTIMIGDKKSAIKEASKVLTNSQKLKAFGNRFLAKIQFKGMMPTINQLKFVYGMTIISRLMVARAKDELRESAVKDSLGFLNLLILGSLVTKGVTRLMNKDFINITKNSGKGVINWIKNSSVKSRDEVLLETLKNNGIKVVEDGKALSYGKLLEAAKALPKDIRSSLKGKLAVLNIAQLVGYAYSGIFLGYYLPKINDKMSKANEEKRIAKLAKEQGKTIEQVKAEMAEEIKKMEAAAAGKENKKVAKTDKAATVDTADKASSDAKTAGSAGNSSDSSFLANANKDFLNKHMAA